MKYAVLLILILSIPIMSQPIGNFTGVYCPDVPDINQPPTRIFGCDSTNYCSPTSAANITVYWDSIRQHTGAAGVNGDLNSNPKFLAENLGFFMATNGYSPNPACGSQSRMNVNKTGTFLGDIIPGLNEWTRWDMTHGFPWEPHTGMPYGKQGHDWDFELDTTVGFNYYTGLIDQCEPPIVIFAYWNPQATGIKVEDPASGDTIEVYTQGEPISQSTDPPEQWPCVTEPCELLEIRAHAVTGVGYVANLDPDGNGPRDWIICHDNWHTTAENMMIDWTVWKATVSAKPKGYVPVAQPSPPGSAADVSICPNPFRPMTFIQLKGRLHNEKVVIQIFTMAGRLIKQWAPSKQKGRAGLTWNALGMPSGVYCLKAVMGDKTYSRKLVLSR